MNKSIKNKNCYFSKNISIKTNLITNFKPSFLQEFNNQFKTKKKNQILCKNFFIYLLLIKYKNNFFFKKSSLFIKKYKKKVYTILRSPYRHKLARHQIAINRYEINSSISINCSKFFNITNWNNFLIFFNFVKSFNKIFESNIIYINNINFFIPIKYKKNFFII